MFGKQYRYCPNCGKQLYDTAILAGPTTAMCCSSACREEWGLKYARCILGKSALAPDLQRPNAEIKNAREIATERGSWVPGTGETRPFQPVEDPMKRSG